MAQTQIEKNAKHRAARVANPLRWRGYVNKARAKDIIKRPWRDSFYGCRARAKRNKIEFALTRPWCALRYTGFCELTKLPFDKRTTGKSGPLPFSISIDRIDQAVGYTPDNCRFILHAVNVFRGTMGDAMMLDVARAILTNS